MEVTDHLWTFNEFLFNTPLVRFYWASSWENEQLFVIEFVCVATMEYILGFPLPYTPICTATVLNVFSQSEEDLLPLH